MISWFKRNCLAYGLDPIFSLSLSYIILILSVATIATVANLITKRHVSKIIKKIILKARPEWSEAISKNKVIERISYIAPAIIIYLFLPLFIEEKIKFTFLLTEILRKITIIYILFIIGTIFNASLNSFYDIYNHFELAIRRPIRSYIQLIKLVLYLFLLILTLSILLDKSPLTFLTGIGAMTAIIILIFKDTILGFVASIQLTLNDTVRIGDWVEIPSFSADGRVIDIALNTVKIKNFDNTISLIPTYSLVSTGIKNWRGMKESGLRRIKRHINIDIRSIRFCDNLMLENFQKIKFVSDFVKSKISKISKDENNLFEITNLEVYREYVKVYLKNYPNISIWPAFLVRTLQPSEFGLPLEYYVFTNETEISTYETIQSKLIEHLLAILPKFKLNVFQIITKDN